MKLLLSGKGRMGQAVEQAARAAGHEIAGSVDENSIETLRGMGRVADVVLDFSHPSALPHLAAYIRRTGTALVSGTTGLTSGDLAVLRELGQYAPVLHSANYSLGIAALRRVLRQVGAVLGDSFDIEIVETHHNQKADAPSGTAKLLWDAVDPGHALTPVYGREGFTGKRPKNEIGIHSLRGGSEAGTHTVCFFGPDEMVELTHRAASRNIFATGALHMAELLRRKGNGFYTMDDLLWGGDTL